MTARAFFDRYQKLASIEQTKDALIEELIQRVTELEGVYQQEQLDHEREKRFNRDIQIHEMELMDQISRTKAIMNREPYIVVLLDGDGMIFQDELLQLGEKGGRKAAEELSAKVEAYVTDNFPNIISPKIITKLYVNMKGLCDASVRGGVMTDPSILDEFARGFNGSFSLFDLVDVGTGKDAAHDKIKESFKLHLYNCHCHQIFLGCSDESPYPQTLEETFADLDLLGRVSLIEGIPFGKNLESLKAHYRITKFPEIFRDSKITPAWAPWKAAVATKPRSLLTPSPNPHVAPLSRTSSNVTTASNSLPVSSTPASSRSGDDFQLVRSKPTSLRSKTVERNKYGQRVDRLDIQSIPREEVNRIKKLKLCNYLFLQGECPNENCHHDHSRKLTKSELQTLTAVARMTPCRYGLECDDPNCMYGHRCPQSEPGRKDCYWGSNCRFNTAAHGIDTNIVKVTKV
ncbi:CCCH zinc finger protein [Aspergillus lucknowensis]|uniref:C3H1-type domain-containing protein n=1 Tax=Aspergillus lucknowensis TaxID=176173 RepID=A0ABR4LF84_9EURO